MAVAMRDKWTDERLDDLKTTVDDGFKRVDQRFAHVDQRLDGLQKTMINGFIALFGTQVTLFAATVGFIVALH